MTDCYSGLSKIEGGVRLPLMRLIKGKYTSERFSSIRRNDQSEQYDLRLDDLNEICEGTYLLSFGGQNEVFLFRPLTSKFQCQKLSLYHGYFIMFCLIMCHTFQVSHTAVSNMYPFTNIDTFNPSGVKSV